jgi:hypothetical protein
MQGRISEKNAKMMDPIKRRMRHHLYLINRLQPKNPNMKTYQIMQA